METVILVKEKYKQDGIGQGVPEESEREVFCEVRGITRSEWVSAGQNSINAAEMLVMPAINYDGERIVILGGARKTVYRTYCPPDSDDIELYLKDEAGGL